MAETVQPISPITTSNRSFKCHKSIVTAVAVFPDGRRMATSSDDKTICLWDLKNGAMLKKMEGHGNWVLAVAVSRDGQLIASGDKAGKLIVWHGETGEFLTQVNQAHSSCIWSLEFSPDGTVLVTGSGDKTTKLWCTNTWQGRPANAMSCGHDVYCVRYSPFNGELAIATLKDIKIWNPSRGKTRWNLHMRKFIAKLDVTHNNSLAWTPDGTCLLSVDFTCIREWDTLTWQQIGDHWTGHTGQVNALAVNSTGTLVASASEDKHVRLWRRSDRETIAIFEHSYGLYCVTFSKDGTHIFSGGRDKKISQWAVPEDASLQDNLEGMWPYHSAEEQWISKILLIQMTVHDPYIIDDVDGSNYNSYANRSLLMARKGHWDNALHDALESVSTQPSVIGYLSQGIAMCGKNLIEDAMGAFDLVFKFTDQGSKTTHLLLLVKAIALFNANQHRDAFSRIQQLAASDACSNADILACHVVEAYLHVQLGITALDNASHNEAVDHFTTAINSSAFSSEHVIHLKYKVFVVLFGWDLKFLWQNANQKRCYTLLRAGRLAEAREAYRYMRDMSVEATTVNFLHWSLAFEQECRVLEQECQALEQERRALEQAECRALYTRNGDSALSLKDYEKAIELYSAAIVLGSVSDTIFASRCNAKLGKMLWEDALVDAQKVQESVNSMFVWYRCSALTIVYLSDVPPSSESGALARSVWNQRGWTVQEFLAPQFVLFYHSDWTLYLNDRSPNHKDSPVIMRELADATGIDPQALVAFRPGMRGAREKLQWVSTRITTLQEDIAYSLFGIFGIHLPVIYGEKKQNALGRLLQDVIAQSGDISCLDWAGKPSEFNSCLPADITSYKAPPFALWSPLSKDAMQKTVSSLRHAVDAELASKLYQTLHSLSAPQFVARRLRLPCIAFAVTDVRQSDKDHQSHLTFSVKADGLQDLLVTTDDDLIQFSPERPTRKAFLLVRPWDRSLLELHDFEDFADTESMDGVSRPISPLSGSPSLGANSLFDSESYSRALRLIAQLGQPFSAFLLAQQWGGEYKRIASDQNITARVKDMTAVHDMMDIRIPDIL